MLEGQSRKKYVFHGSIEQSTAIFGIYIQNRQEIQAFKDHQVTQLRYNYSTMWDFVRILIIFLIFFNDLRKLLIYVEYFIYKYL